VIEVRREAPDAPAGCELFAAYLELVRERLPGYTPTEAIHGDEAAFRGPGAAWLVLYEDGAPLACGGLRTLAPGVGEIKRMFVRPRARGRGLGRRLLAELEAIARAAGLAEVRLYTTEVLAEARALYDSAGYELASTHEEDGRRDFWLQKRLGG